VECSRPNATGARRHIRAALDAGASRDEILCVFTKIATFTAFRASNFGAAILLEEASTETLEEAAVERAKRLKDPSLTPNSDKIKAAGLWNPAWDASSDFAPLWTDSLVASAFEIYSSGALPPMLIEFVKIALGAWYSHMDAPGTRRCIKAALRHGATVAEIFEVLKICVIQGVQTFNLGVPILAEELARRSNTRT
jgi:alkylhydroperoxidase/carboxymuconolactone decarboxylase family protein YurZ